MVLALVMMPTMAAILVKNIVTKQMNLDDKKFDARNLRYAISNAKNLGLTPTDYARENPHFRGKVISEVYQAYQMQLSQNNALDFESNLKSNGNETLWESLDYDGDGSWILNGMINRYLIIIHDGSYMKEISPSISAAATMIYCTIAKKRCKCT